ncbi:MAG: Set3 complex subunit with deacetylase activity, meiotic-specific repressor of sporulation proteins [Bathelium mastoideum]|nr:MAG: Set3 complex subunit with deacetylase activity, meiotic-specific repressor of sporulation proteins [Bathelium mastoideum]
MSSTTAGDADSSASKPDPAADPSRQQTATPNTRPLSSTPPTKDDARLAHKDPNVSEAVTDVQADSEAETEILSHDQKEEAVNGAIIKHENTEDTPMIDAPNAGEESFKSRFEAVKSPDGTRGGGARRRASEAGETVHEKSKPNSQRTSPTISAPSAGLRKSSSLDAPTPEAKNGSNDRESPIQPASRKRKARDETSPEGKREFEPPRQRQKPDRPDLNAQHNSRERSPSPKKYPHRRTSSIQAILPNGQAQNKKRRPAHISTSTGRLPSYQEESDTASSSDATPYPQAQPKRSSHRSVSTPGRAMAPRKKLKDRYGMTAFAIACQEGDLDRAKETLAEDPLMLDEPDNDQNTPLQSAALAGQEHIVEYLIGQHCNIHTMNRLQETPLIDAVENAEVKVVRLLLDAGVDPSRPNKKGRQPIDLVPKPDPNDEDELAAAKEIRNLLKAAIQRNHGSNRTPRAEQPEDNEDENKKRKDLDILDRTTKNLRNLVENNDKYGVRTFLEAMVRVDNSCLVAAAKGGHTDLMNVLLPFVDPDKVDFTKPLVATIGRGHIDIVDLLLKQDLDPTLKSSDDKFYWEIAEERQGPNWQTERSLFKKAYDDAILRKDKKRFKTSPESKSKLGSASKREKADKLLPGPTSPHEKRRHSSSSNVQRPLSPELTKPRRALIRGKDREPSNNGSARRRRVIDDEDESDEEEDIKSSPGRQKVGKPKASSSPGLKRKERHTSEPTASKARDDKPVLKHAVGDVERSRSEKSAELKIHSRKREAEDEADSLVHRERKQKEQAERRERELKEKETRERETREREAKEAAEREAQEREKQRLAKEAAEREAAEKEKERLAKEAADREAREAAEREKERLAKEAADAEREAAERERQRLAREAAEREAEDARRRQAEAEAAAAMEKARQEEEERQRREAEQREREQRERERQQRLSRLPPAISAACQLGTQLPLKRTKYLESGGIIESGVLDRFTPIIGIQGHEIGIDTATDPNPAAADELWVLNYQASTLLALPEIDPARNEATAHWRVLPSTRAQRETLWVPVSYDSSFAYPPPGPQRATIPELQARRAEYARIKQVWLDCEDIAWVRWADVDAAARQSPRLNVPGVKFYVEIRVHFDLIDDPPLPPPVPSTPTDQALATSTSTTPTPNAVSAQVPGDTMSISAPPPPSVTSATAATPMPARRRVRKARLELEARGVTGFAALGVLQERDRAVPGVGEWRGGEGEGQASLPPPQAAGSLSQTSCPPPSKLEAKKQDEQQHGRDTSDAMEANKAHFGANSKMAVKMGVSEMVGQKGSEGASAESDGGPVAGAAEIGEVKMDTR